MQKEMFDQLIERCECSALTYFRYKSELEEVEFSKITDQRDTLKNVVKTDISVLQKPVEDKRPVEACPTDDIEAEQLDLFTVKSEGVGIVGSVSAAVGETVKRGDVICTLEAMKLYNDITSPVTGVIEELLVEEGKKIAYQQGICRIRVKADEV